MIDFRYHIVSIVSIFLALAVGIVLGAGPLKNEIGSTLQGEVAGLRQDKADLNDQLALAQSENEQQDSYLAAVSSRVLAGALPDRRVALVVLPGADAGVSEAVSAAVASAGGTVTSTTSVSQDWVSTDEAVAASRDTTVEQVATATGVDVSGTGDDTPRNTLLAALLSRSAVVGDSGPDDATARTGVESLAEAGLVSLDTEEFSRAELVVVVAGPVTDGDSDAQSEEASRWVSLATALSARSRGTVLAADLASDGESEGTSVLTTFRDDSTATSEASSVDDAAGPTGVASVVFALSELDGGDHGQYGLGPGADAPFAPVPGS